MGSWPTPATLIIKELQSCSSLYFCWGNNGKTQLVWKQHDTPLSITLIFFRSTKSPSIVPHHDRRKSVRNLKRENNGKTRISERNLHTLLIMEQTRHEQKQEDSQTNKVDCASFRAFLWRCLSLLLRMMDSANPWGQHPSWPARYNMHKDRPQVYQRQNRQSSIWLLSFKRKK